jgi:hypothetical protein
MALSVDRYRMRSPVLPLLRRFETAVIGDKAAEKKASRNTSLSMACGFGAFLSIFLAAFTFELLSRLIWLLPPLLAALAIVFGMAASRARRFDLDDRKLEAIIQVLRMLRADTPHNAPVELTADFRHYDKGGKLIEEEKAGVFGAATTRKYSHEWLRLRGFLADGTHYQISAVDDVSRRDKRKRKYTKVKERVKGSLSLQLRFRAAKYGDINAVAATLKAMTPPSPLSLKRLASKGRRLSITLGGQIAVRVKGRYGTEEQIGSRLITGDTILRALVWIYDGIGRNFAGAAT